MKRTFTINLNNSIFNIDEDAYNALQSYLASLKNHFSKEDGGDEILQDIENRISEICKTKITSYKEVITINDINEIIDTLGRPEMIIDNDTEKQEKNTTNQEREEFRKTRRIYRDTDNRVLGGVGSGLGAYFNIDPVLVRVILVLTFFFAGPLVYLVLWIAIPAARTTAQKLEMKGEKVTISNIEKSIRDEFNDVKDNFKKYKSSDNYSHVKETGNRFLDLIVTVFHSIFKLVLITVGIALIVTGIILLIGFSGSFMFNDLGINNISIPTFFNLFASEQSVFLASVGLFLIVSMILLSIIYGGIKLIFNIRGRNKIFAIPATILWLVGLFLIIYVSFSEGRNFKTKSSHSQHEIISTNCDTLFVSSNLVKVENEIDIENDEFILGTLNSRNVMGLNPKVDIVKSDSEDFEIIIQKKSRGKNKKDAQNNARNIEYKYALKDSLLTLNSHYIIPENSKFRVQEMKIQIKIPVGKSIFIDENLFELLNKTDNEECFEDLDMVGKTWLMNQEGLRLAR